MRLHTCFAPASEVKASLKSRGGPSSFDHATRSRHPTINNNSGEMLCCCAKKNETPSTESLMVEEDSTNELEASASTLEGKAPKAVFVVDFNGAMYVCKHPLGRILYFGCGRLIRRILHNPALFFVKGLTSSLIFFTCWYTMHLGGALATWKFPRVSQTDHVVRLPDLIMDWAGNPDTLEVCQHSRATGGFGGFGMPGADMALLLNLICTLIETFAGQHGHVHFQRTLHMSAMIFLCRTTVVGLTGLNQPNNRCLPIQATEMTYGEAMRYVFSTFPHRSCADLIYSGHTALLTLWIINMNMQNGIVAKRLWLKIWIFVQSAWGISLLVVCGSHYSVDVALGIYFAYFISEIYYVRALNVYNGNGWLGRLIQRLEYWGDDWEKAGRLPGCMDEEERVVRAGSDNDRL